MGNLFTSLGNAANSLRAFERGLAVVQNNVANASTPGYVRQTQTFTPKSLDLNSGLAGGVEADELVSSRNPFAEQAVWRYHSGYSYQSQKKESLQSLESAFLITEGRGVASSIDNLFKAFSQLTVAPNDLSLRQNALNQAENLAVSFNQMSISFAEADTRISREAATTVDQINAIAVQLADVNAQRRSSFATVQDTGLDARLHNLLEELATLTNFVAIPLDDGSMSVFVGGQTLLVAGDRQFPLSAHSTPAGSVIQDQAGNDITDQITSGSLAALVEVRNSLIPAYQSSLNVLAVSVADQVNAVLAGGIDSTGNPPVLGLFSYSSPSDAAATLAMNSLTVSDLALAMPGAPGGNGNVLNLVALAQMKTTASETFTDFYGQLSAVAGRDLTAAMQAEHTAQQALDQSLVFRADVSGVSLDEEAALMLQYQRSYQAMAQMFTTINQMMDTLFAMSR